MIKDLIIAALIIAIVYLVFFQPKPKDSDTVVRLYDSLQTLSDSLTELGKLSIHQNEKIIEIQREQEQTEKDFKIAGESWKRKEIARRAEIQHLIDSLPKLQEYIALRDSIEVFKDARIYEMNEEKRIQRMAYNDLIKINVAGLAVQDLMLRNQRMIIEEKDKELAREKKKKITRTIRDILIGAGTVYVVDRIAELAE